MSLYSGVRGRREREREREREGDQFGGKTSSVGSGPGARKAGKLRKLPQRENTEIQRDTFRRQFWGWSPCVIPTMRASPVCVTATKPSSGKKRNN